MLQAIAGYDPGDTTSRQLPIPDYTAVLRDRVSSLRVGVAWQFFFDGLEPEIEAAMKEALPVLQKLTAGVRDMTIPARTQEQLRNTCGQRRPTRTTQSLSRGPLNCTNRRR